MYACVRVCNRDESKRAVMRGGSLRSLSSPLKPKQSSPLIGAAIAPTKLTAWQSLQSAVRYILCDSLRSRFPCSVSFYLFGLDFLCLSTSYPLPPHTQIVTHPVGPTLTAAVQKATNARIVAILKKNPCDRKHTDLK